MSEQEIYEGILQKDNQTFLYLYDAYKGKILGMVQKNSGTETDALDIFQEGIICLWTNISQGKFQLRSQTKISTYLYTLCRNLWISKLRKQKPSFAIDGNLGLEQEGETEEMEAHYERIRVLESQFKKLDQACQKLLKLFYYQKKSLKEIASQLSLTEKTAKNNKYRCMQKLRAMY